MNSIELSNQNSSSLEGVEKGGITSGSVDDGKSGGPANKHQPYKKSLFAKKDKNAPVKEEPEQLRKNEDADESS